ncbi:helix-turn-helix domain-containing protein [Cohnella thailandensis]|uniref:Response regulator n=1 Tax=Cohnella thailandensis TaxID=557557 RepID=A0A841SWI3_9BACL|nr:helix-turn-helix domain-containing protein [Cohnella thailandensis]MBB6633091.1 response regulator [Cohnella thailandensis]MBP1975214.1 two-component system response regulator YesN [Cohnella thailandensis]
MLNVLLVDDEPLALSHMRRLIDWNRHGFRICGEARNGKEAIELIERQTPHIVVADIHMAGMSGVELNRYVYERYRGKIKTVMVSSFDDYDFVRETMRNGASDYVLKHRIEADGWLELLARLKEEIRQTEDKSEGLDFVERNWPAVHAELEQTYLRNIALGLEVDRASAEEYLRRLSPLGSGRLVVAALRLSEASSPVDRFPDEERKIQRARATLDLIRQCMTEERGIAVPVEEGRYLLLFSFDEERSEYAIHQRVRVCLRRVADLLKLYMNMQVVYGIGPVGTGLDQLAAYYRSALEAAPDGVRPASKAEIPGGGGTATAAATGISLRQEKALIGAAEQAGSIAVDAILDDIFSTLRDSGNRQSMAQSVTELIELADKIWKKSGLHGDAYYEGEWLSRAERSDPNRLDAVEEWTKSLYAQLIAKLESGHQSFGRFSIHVQQAIQLIRAHYASPISLEQTADRIGISDTYLGRIFKRETGTYFTDYLNRFRIEAAKQLIDGGGHKAKQIYERVGFTSYTYFFKVFKVITGMTPQEYARSSLHQ